MSVRREMDRLSERLDRIDSGGTRGVGVIQQQITDMAKDLADLKNETNTWQTGHERQHNADVRERATGRRWMIGTTIAGAAALTTIIGILVDIASQVHHLSL